MDIRVLAFFTAIILACAQPAEAGDMTVNELRQIALSGGSIIVDLDKKHYTVSALVNAASSLSHGANLTIKESDGNLTATQCQQIARAKPGQMKFWF